MVCMRLFPCSLQTCCVRLLSFHVIECFWFAIPAWTRQLFNANSFPVLHVPACLGTNNLAFAWTSAGPHGPRHGPDCAWDFPTSSMEAMITHRLHVVRISGMSSLPIHSTMASRMALRNLESKQHLRSHGGCVLPVMICELMR